MKFANLAGRMVLLIRQGTAIYLERESKGLLPTDPLAALDRWPEVLSWSAGHAGIGAPFRPADLGPPVANPRQVFAVALNYRSHVRESSAEMPMLPSICSEYQAYRHLNPTSWEK